MLFKKTDCPLIMLDLKEVYLQPAIIVSCGSVILIDPG